jgi:hypothetical protein
MAINDTDVSICSHALNLLGENTISSFSDGSTQAGICEAIYPDVRAMMLGMAPWSFSIKKSDLQRSATAPINEWNYAYPMASDSLTGVPRAVFASSAVGAQPVTGGWEIYERAVLTDYEEITIDYQAIPLEQEMPSYFIQLLKYAMAWHLAEPVTDQISKAVHWERITIGTQSDGGRGGYFRQASNIDGQGKATQFIGDYPLVSVRMAG